MQDRRASGGLDRDAGQQLATTWRARRSRVKGATTSEGYSLDHVRELGWMDSESYEARAKDCIQREIVPPLARRGIVIPPGPLAAALA